MTVTAYRDLEVIEAAIIILFSFCSVSISNPEEQAFKRPQRYNFQGIRSWLRHSFVPFGKMLIDLALNCYWLWFWIVGMEQLTLSPCTGYGFFFAQVSLFGWFRTLGKIVTSMMVVLDLFIIGRVLFYGKPLPKWFVKITEPRIRGEEPCFDCAGDFFGFMVSIAIVGFYVMSVELMIRWNGIQGAHHPRISGKWPAC